MSKGGVIVLIIAAIVFTGLGFVIGNVVLASGNNPGSKEDPVMTQSGVEQLLSVRISELEAQIDQLEVLLNATSDSNTGTEENGNTEDPDSSSPSNVEVTSDSVNVRASASISASVVASVTAGTVLTYLGDSEDGEWYHVELSDGTEGYIASYLCGEPY